MPLMYPPVPEVPRLQPFDPVGSLVGGVGRGLDLYAAIEKMRALQQARQQQEQLRQVLPRALSSGDLSALAGVAPELALRLHEMTVRQVPHQIEAAAKYFDIAAPFLSRENLPAFYRTLQERFGIPTVGWPVPKTDEEFQQILRRMQEVRRGVKEGHVALVPDPVTGQLRVIPLGANRPTVIQPPRGGRTVDAQNLLRSLGLPPTPENMQRALEMLYGKSERKEGAAAAPQKDVDKMVGDIIKDDPVYQTAIEKGDIDGAARRLREIKEKVGAGLSGARPSGDKAALQRQYEAAVKEAEKLPPGQREKALQELKQKAKDLGLITE